MDTPHSENKTALITGVSGFIGRHIAKQLVADGWEVFGTVHGKRTHLPDIVEFRLDVCEQDTLEEILRKTKPSVVFHMAAIVDTVETNSVTELQRVNILGTVTVTEAVKKIVPDAKIIFASSAFVYGMTTPEDQPLKEDRPLYPETPYGASKIAAEAILQQYAHGGGHAVIGRAFQQTGPGHKGNYALPDWAEQIAKIEVLTNSHKGEMKTGNLDVKRDYLDVRDAANAFILLNENGKDGEVYNICSNNPIAMRDLLFELSHAFEVSLNVTIDESRVRRIDQPIVYGDNTKLVNEIGWTQKYSLKETMTDLADYWRNKVTPK